MQLVCLAKSKKYGGRCLAGVEVQPSGSGGHRVVRDEGEPRWIRPVTANEHGEVPESLVRDVCLLDIIELVETEPDPRGFQVENIRFASSSVSTVRTLPATNQVLDNFVTQRTGPLFGNRGKAVSAEQARLLDHSLLLIQVNDVAFLETESSSGKPQLRAEFTHEKQRYDLPVTDPEFERSYRQGQVPASASHFYVTISLGVPYEGWHYKLIAGVFLVT